MEESFPMIGGNGPHSYSKNSQKQKEAAERGKEILAAAIDENLDLKQFTSGHFSIVDLGCSTGPNTFFAVNNIMKIIIKKYRIEGHSSLPEFQVFFSDHASNDFNTLFANLPANGDYFATGVPGSFYGRLFPESSINFFHSALALHWLSKAPKELRDPNSPACNKGRIYYGNAPNEVGEAYAAHYAKDMESFLGARAIELARGGLMALVITGRPAETIPAQFSLGPFYVPFESCLIEMANEGLLSGEKIDSFNVPTYSPSIDEVKNLVKKNGHFVIVRLETAPQPSTVSLPAAEERRATLGSLFSNHFGNSITEELFERYAKNIKGYPPIRTADGIPSGLFILLKRK